MDQGNKKLFYSLDFGSLRSAFPHSHSVDNFCYLLLNHFFEILHEVKYLVILPGNLKENNERRKRLVVR